MMKKPIALSASLAVMLLGIFLLLRTEPPRMVESGTETFLYSGLDTAQVDGVTIRSGADHVSLVREDGVWKVATEDGFPADPAGVDQVLRTVAELTSGDTTSRKPEEHEQFEVDSAGAIDVRLTTGSVTASRFFVGKSGPDYTSTYLRDSGSDEVLLQSASIRNVFERGGNTWKSKIILHLDMDRIETIRITQGGERLELRNDFPAGWTVIHPEGHQPNGPYMQELVHGLARLSAVDFGSVDDRERAGLDEPVAEVRITMLNGSEQMLRIGGEWDGGKRRFVERNRNGVLYLVPPSRLAAILGPIEDLIEPVPTDKEKVEP